MVMSELIDVETRNVFWEEINVTGCLSPPPEFRLYTSVCYCYLADYSSCFTAAPFIWMREKCEILNKMNVQVPPTSVYVVCSSSDQLLPRSESALQGGRKGVSGGSNYKLNLYYHVSSICGKTLWVLGLRGVFSFRRLGFIRKLV